MRGLLQSTRPIGRRRRRRRVVSPGRVGSLRLRLRSAQTSGRQQQAQRQRADGGESCHFSRNYNYTNIIVNLREKKRKEKEVREFENVFVRVGYGRRCWPFRVYGASVRARRTSVQYCRRRSGRPGDPVGRSGPARAVDVFRTYTPTINTGSIPITGYMVHVCVRRNSVKRAVKVIIPTLWLYRIVLFVFYDAQSMWWLPRCPTATDAILFRSVPRVRTIILRPTAAGNGHAKYFKRTTRQKFILFGFVFSTKSY